MPLDIPAQLWMVGSLLSVGRNTGTSPEVVKYLVVTDEVSRAGHCTRGATDWECASK